MVWGLGGRSNSYSLYDNTIDLRTINTYITYTLSGTLIVLVTSGTISTIYFTYETASDPLSPLHDSSEEIMTHK